MRKKYSTSKSPEKPVIVYIVCICMFLSTGYTLLLTTTELAHMVGQWYVNYLLSITLLTWIALVGVWKMKKWGIILFTATTLSTEIVLARFNVLWTASSMILPATAIGLLWWNYKKETKNQTN